MASQRDAIGSGTRRRESSHGRSLFRIGPGGLRRGFTLVELLVVITIISMLVALLLPAINGARARARRTQCENNQHNLGLAVFQYEMPKRRLPGYVNWFGAPVWLPAPGSNDNTRNLSWVIMVFEHLGRDDLWRRWGDANVTMAQKLDPTDVDHYAVVKMPTLICPDDDSEETAALSYVANCGLSDFSMSDAAGNLDPTGVSNADDVEDIEPIFLTPPAADRQAALAAQSPYYGLFFNHNGGTRYRALASRDSIQDGTAETVLLSENLQASSWAPIDSSGQLKTPTQLDVGMVWWSPNPSAGYAATLLPSPPSPAWPSILGGGIINNKRDAGSLPPNIPERRFFARPSSNHPGGVLVTYCDGHSGFVADEVEYDVYLAMMTPNGEKASSAPNPANRLIP